MLNKNSLHHAYILEGDRELLYENLCNFCESDLEFKIKANPDFWYGEFDRFAISDARNLREMQMKKTTDIGKKIFIVAFNFITREAQNALLKVLEEPTEGTHIFIITPSSHIFLDTVLSRVTLIKSEQSNEAAIDPKAFMKDSYAKRIEKVTKFVKQVKDEKASKADAILFVRNLQKTLREEMISKKRYETKSKLRKLSEIEDYLHDTSSSVKMLLEQTALL